MRRLVTIIMPVVILLPLTAEAKEWRRGAWQRERTKFAGVRSVAPYA